MDGYRNPEVDRLTGLGVQTLDPRKRMAIYQKLQAIIALDEPDIFLYWSYLLSAASTRLHGYRPQPYDTSLTWNVKDWSLSP